MDSLVNVKIDAADYPISKVLSVYSLSSGKKLNQLIPSGKKRIKISKAFNVWRLISRYLIQIVRLLLIGIGFASLSK